MLYQPNFCCQCGTKIERLDWKFWTSRRFCEACEKDFRKEEWIPKIMAGLIILFGILGFGSYLRTPERPVNATGNEVVRRSSSNGSSNKVQNLKPASGAASNNIQTSESNRASTFNTASPNRAAGQTNTKPPISAPTSSESDEAGPPQILVTEPVYYCGAQTKKGTACTRRVKGGGRCWQHTGQPALLPKEKLLINR